MEFFRDITKRLSNRIRITVLLIFFSTATLFAAAQNGTPDNTTMTTTESTYLPCGNAFLDKQKDSREWSLRLGATTGYGMVRDMGTAPISFHGPLLTAVAGVRNDRIKWKFHLDVITSLGYYENAIAPRFNFSTFDISNTLRIKVLRRVYNPLPFPDMLWVGVGACNFLNVTVNTNYENASAGVSDFLGPELHILGKQQLGLSRWSLFGGVSLMPVATMLRPGYAYIDNYTASQPVSSAQFDNYQWSARFFAAVSTEIGFQYVMENNNKLHFSYRWEYYSSGKKGAWRFDHATHGLYLDMIVHLKQKIIYEKEN